MSPQTEIYIKKWFEDNETLPVTAVNEDTGEAEEIVYNNYYEAITDITNLECGNSVYF